tara:strand:+ start:159 stop:431 length:273 start_codon:yes stop_codon:yes gene_type:complete
MKMSFNRVVLGSAAAVFALFATSSVPVRAAPPACLQEAIDLCDEFWDIYGYSSKRECVSEVSRVLCGYGAAAPLQSASGFYIGERTRSGR